ncbi:unnamed protein product [Pleuronectes platessa]|uniref:Uncharacterized protein n=1 Tax=Pleuronectes platessa TaxID=8262 RepID=A0A9N7UBL6_PLEPL|nr:unnamed protein product [Pleuronectes platessa]
MRTERARQGSLIEPGSSLITPSQQKPFDPARSVADGTPPSTTHPQPTPHLTHKSESLTKTGRINHDISRSTAPGSPAGSLPSESLEAADRLTAVDGTADTKPEQRPNHLHQE